MKILAKINIDKIDKTKITTRTYTNRDGQTVSEKEYSFEIIELKEEKQKVIKTGDTWEMVKTHFIVESKEKGSTAPDNFIGEGVTFRDIQGSTLSPQEKARMEAEHIARVNARAIQINEAEGECNPNDIPF